MRTLLPALPEPVQDLLDVALAFEKERRYTSARAMKAALDAAAKGHALASASPVRTPLVPLAPSERSPSVVPEHASPSLGAMIASETLLARAWARRGISQTNPEAQSNSRKRVAIGAVLGAVTIAAIFGAAIGRNAPITDAAPPSSGLVSTNSASELPPTPALASSELLVPTEASAPTPTASEQEAVAKPAPLPASEQKAIAKPTPLPASEQKALTRPASPPLTNTPRRVTGSAPTAPVASASARAPAPASSPRDPLGSWQ